jgi:rod shape-determining protein MreB
VAKRLLDRELLFGEEVMKHRLSLNFCFPMERGTIKEDARDTMMAKHLLRHLVSSAGVKVGSVVYAIIGVPAQTSSENKTRLFEVCKELINNVAVISEPFAVAYHEGIMENTLVVDIGAGTIDVCRVHGSMPEEPDQITSYKAGDYVDEVFYGSLRSRHPAASFTMKMIQDIKERYAFVHDVKRSVSAIFPVEGRPETFDVTEDLKHACESIVPDIVESIRRMISSFDPEFQSTLKENVYLAGGGSQIDGLPDMLRLSLEDIGLVHIRKVDDPYFACAKGALKLAKDMPEDYWEAARA